MKYKYVPKFFPIVIGLIVGGALWQQFDPDHLRFDNTILSLMYLFVLISCIYAMVLKVK